MNGDAECGTGVGHTPKQSLSHTQTQTNTHPRALQKNTKDQCWKYGDVDKHGHINRPFCVDGDHKGGEIRTDCSLIKGQSEGMTDFFPMFPEHIVIQSGLWSNLLRNPPNRVK